MYNITQWQHISCLIIFWLDARLHDELFYVIHVLCKHYNDNNEWNDVAWFIWSRKDFYKRGFRKWHVKCVAILLIGIIFSRTFLSSHKSLKILKISEKLSSKTTTSFLTSISSRIKPN